VLAIKERLSKRAEELFQEQQQNIYRQTDQLFAKLLLWQWLATVLIAVFVSPQTWAGQTSTIHTHVWASIFIGGAISLFPIWLTRAWPGAAITRYVIAVGQMLMSALLISVTGGRIETHFHVFGSLVILSFYRDWRVLIPATIVVAVDHFVRGVYWPYSVYGVLNATPLRSIEHAAWVVFEDIFLVISCLRSIGEMRSIANRTAELEASEEGFRRIFDEAPIGVGLVDRDYRFVKVNAALCNMVGYTEQELTQLKSLDVTFPEDLELTRRYASEVDNDTVGLSFEKRYVRKDKEIIWINCTVHPIEFGDSQTRYYLGMIEDITQRKRAEAEIKELNQALEQRVQERTAELFASEKRYRRLFDQNPEPMWVFDIETLAFLEVNQAAVEHYGFSRDEFLKMTLKDIRPVEDVPALVKDVARLQSGITEHQRAWKHRKKDGTIIDVAITATEFPWNERPSRLVLAIDVSERKQAEDALREAEQKYRAIFENAVEGIFQTTPDGHYLSVNRALARIYGYDSPEDLVASVSDIGGTIYVDRKRRAEFKQLIETNGSVELFEYEVFRKDGKRVWLCENARAVYDGTGKVLYYEGSVEDITERKRVDEVERASKAKSEFLSRMSHELRTPLNAILGFSQLLDRQKPTETQRKRISYILNAGRHLLKLIDEVLDIARVESGRFQLSLEPVPVEHAVDEAIDLMRPLAAEQGIDIERTALVEASPSIQADRQRLKQVLLNFLSNAVKYNRPSGRVVVDFARQPDERFRISVIDEGPGIPPDKRSRLFSPFDRLGAEHSGTEGTGLGLALSKRLTEAMGGTIGEGGPALGACFWVEFPIVKSVHEQLEPDREELVPLENLNGQTKTLLYIEDNLSNLSLIEHLLGDSSPIKLISAMQGKLGIELAARHQPDLILLDVHLPDINGPEVLARLKAKPRTRDIPVAVLSADATQSQIKRLMSLGASEYLTKPLDVDHFLKVLDEHFSEAEPSGVQS
jgi:PAS domain S-box-containing protein